MIDTVQHVCMLAKARGVSFADCRIVESSGTTVAVQDGRADKVSGGIAAGIGVRVLCEGVWGFAFAPRGDARTAEAALEEALATAAAISGATREEGAVAEVEPARDTVISPVVRDPRKVPVAEKVSRLSALERAARGQSDQVVNTAFSYIDGVTREVVGSTAGTLIDQTQIRTFVVATVTAYDGKRRQRGVEVRGRAAGTELLEGLTPEEFSIPAAERACRLLRAKEPPAGEFPVVFHPSISGLFAHEVVGHNAEADAVWTGNSTLVGRLGEEIASPKVSIVDDSTVPGSAGSFAYDSEGVPGRCRTIIRNGRLEGFLHGLETAARMGVEPTGSGRAEDHASRPIVRMSNTYFLPGEDSFEEMLSGIDRGVYLREGHYGHVFVERGQFTCHAGEAQMIENGKLGEPLRDVSISGLMLEVLKEIDAVGSDLEIEMPGRCGKNGQSAETDAGGPHLRVRRVIVGGAG